MNKAEEQALENHTFIGLSFYEIERLKEEFLAGYKQAKQDLWHNVKDETPMDGERLLLINRNGEYGTTMIMMPILHKEFRNWEKWAYIKDLIPSE